MEKHWAFHESCTQNFSPISIQILDPKLLVSTRVLSANSLTNFASFLLTGTELKYHLPITYYVAFQVIDISPMSKFWWLLQSGWKHELKSSHNSSGRKGDVVRTCVRILKLDKILPRQRLLQSCLLKSQIIKTKQNQKKT